MSADNHSVDRPAKVDTAAAVQAMRGAFNALFEMSYLVRSNLNLYDSIMTAVDLFMYGLVRRDGQRPGGQGGAK
ncbi:hypothetical protein FE783_25560 [Paenibacillus mesophilus]|uniref:hypothetical protein n=1 Tax=Paenibacillus mesophilus TaxID=2582849 RepID=UPI00110E59FB|nr:hypothetical protein [Paenibacillus mesophilus]TMV46678.1 hypothetical protein FE783_25560 [Paenibacillus mesophilus]